MGGNRSKRKTGSFRVKLVKKSKFQLAVESTDDVKKAYCTGIKAVKASDREKIVVSNLAELQGSLDIDYQMKDKEPEANRWDYVLSYGDKLYFFEIHSAETSEVDRIILKLTWLKKWLKKSAPKIEELPKADVPYTWVQSGRFAILQTSKVKMKLSQAGIVTARSLLLR